MWRRDKEAGEEEGAGREGEQAEEEEGKWGQLREVGSWERGWELGERLIGGGGWGKLMGDGHRPQDSRSWGPRLADPAKRSTDH